MNWLISSFGTIFIFLINTFNADSNSSFVRPDFLHISFEYFSISVNINSGAYSLICSLNIRNRVKSSLINAANTMFASITRSIF